MITDETATPASATLEAPPEFAYRMDARFTLIQPIGLVPEGFRVDAHYEGRVIEGPLAGSIVRGVDYLLVRSDGVSVLDIRQLTTTGKGEQIALRAQGYGSFEPGTPMPSLEALSSPHFVWPDASSHLAGVAFCQTAAPAFLWMNHTPIAFIGLANFGTRKVDVTARVVAPEMFLLPASH